MANDNTLAIRLEARIRDFEKQMAKASGTATREFKKIERASENMSSKLTGVFKNFGRGLVAGVAAGGVAGIVSQIGQIAKGVANVGAEAKRAGVSAKAFQEIGYVAQQSGVGIDALVDGLKELNLRADEFIVTGKGPAAEAFARLGYTADELKRKLQDPSALFSEIIGKLQKLDTAAQIRIADEIFGGTGGEQFVRFIEQGEAGIKRSIGEARRLGLVMSDDVIAKATELDRQFNKVTQTVGTALKKAIVEASAALSGFIDEFQRLQQRQAEAQRAADAGAWVGGMVRPEGAVPTTPTRDRPTALDARMGVLATQLSEADQKLVEALRKRYADAASQAATIPPPPGKGGGGSSSKDTFDADADAFRNMLGYTEEYVEAQELANQRLEHFGDLAGDAANSLATAFADGKLEASEILSIVGQIAQQLLRMPGGLSGLASLFSGGGFNPTVGGFASMLGLPRRASGGPVQAGKAYVVGEKRPELFVPGESGRIIPRVPAGGAVVIQNVVNNAPPGTTTKTEKSRMADGRMMYRTIIDVVNQGEAEGAFDKSRGARYGIKPMQTVR